MIFNAPMSSSASQSCDLGLLKSGSEELRIAQPSVTLDTWHSVGQSWPSTSFCAHVWVHSSAPQDQPISHIPKASSPPFNRGHKPQGQAEGWSPRCSPSPSLLPLLLVFQSQEPSFRFCCHCGCLYVLAQYVSMFLISLQENFRFIEKL